MTSSIWTAAARTVLPAFGLGDAKLALVRPHWPVFRVTATDGRQFALKFRPDDHFDDAAARVQLRWLDDLGKRSDIGAPVAMRTLARRRFTHLNQNGKRLRAVCFTWTPGRPPRGASFLRPAPLMAMARVVGQLHHFSVRYRPTGLASCPQIDAAYFFGPKTFVGERHRGRLTQGQFDLLRRAADRIRPVLGRAKRRPEQFGLIHGDLEPPNWTFHRGVPRPIDFDEFGVGPYLFDLMQVIWTYALGKELNQYCADLLAGYESVRPLSAEDRREVPFHLALPFIQWLNRGLKADAASAAEFDRWAPPTVRRIGELCGLA